ncbi:hypothetical protein M406DRAFT_69237 [Cryphonectria parasitica EP155]|uniref:Uncharacterized protein n=1 Tax=Cryphonectria parasitica (strain ATCC 38755 / EP155) TaxID=660469 RepID=A0A9P5CQC1_CRYP1|nr:uncharacterized protein M406DRAFT_69237 [Cryphonectria parasitica EP155]KAF3767073.1 hypothetical protein M406DRAFT_69237 [Cryphonectria parasitica EP155]
MTSKSEKVLDPLARLRPWYRYRLTKGPRRDVSHTQGRDHIQKYGVMSIAFSPDYQLVAAGCLGKSAYIWDIQSGNLAERLEGSDEHNNAVYDIAFSPSGKDVKMWGLRSARHLQDGNDQAPKEGRCLKTFKGQRGYVLGVVLTPDAQWMLSGSSDRSVQSVPSNKSRQAAMFKSGNNSELGAPGS